MDNFDVNYINKFNCNTGTGEYPFDMQSRGLEVKRKHINIRHNNLSAVKIF